MKITIFILVAVLALIGLGYFKFFRTKKVQSNPDIKIKDKDGQVPEFERVYTVELTEGRTLEVTIKDYGLSDLGLLGKLRQPDDKYVFFDPESVADKIIDRDLTPLVQKYCDQIISQDKAWRDSKPSKFKDENGTIWRRVDK